MAAPFHLRRLLSDGTYENAGYALERGVILVEHDAGSVGCASTPSSAYYSDLSGSNSGGSHQHPPWPALASQRRKRNNSGSLSLPHHYCHQSWVSHRKAIIHAALPIDIHATMHIFVTRNIWNHFIQFMINLKLS